MKSLFFPILYVTTASSALPVIAGIVYYRRTRLDVRFLTVLFNLMLLIGFYYLYCAWRHHSANWIHHFYSPVEFAIFGGVIATWQSERLVKRAIILSVILFALLCAWDIIVVGDWRHTSDFTASVACAAYVGMSSYTLVGVERRQYGQLHKDYRFWLLVGLLIYSAGNLAYFAFFTRIVSYYLWAGHNFLNVLANICYAIGIVCQARWD